MSEIIMPKMGDAMTEGKVIRWYKKPGDKVSKGEPVLEIETDKVNLDLEAEADGVLGDHEVAEGEVAQVGDVLAIVGDGKSKPAAKKDQKKKDDEPAKQAASVKEQKPTAEADEPAGPPQPEAKHPEAEPKKQRTEEPEAQEAPARGKQEGRRAPSSPLARRMASELGVDLGSVRGSGPNGRIVASDVEAASKGGGARETAAPPAGGAPAAPSAFEGRLEEKDVPLSAMRRTIAKRLVESLGPIPHFFLTVGLDVTELLELRRRVNEISPVKTSVNDFIVRASALAMHQHPLVNASFGSDAITLHGDVHVGIAVATPEGLITPVIRNADRKGVPQIAAEVRDLAERAKNRKLRPEEYQGSTFTISNLGMFGIEEFTAVINPPNVAILAVGAAGPQPVVVDGQVVVRQRMRLTMSCDHRVVDGAVGAEYLQTLRGFIEQPLKILV